MGRSLGKLLPPPPASWKTEAVAGVTTFFTMAYIVVVNPSILAAPGTGIAFQGAMTATVLLACVMTLAMGLYARLPFAVAPGMGLNAFFTYSLILGQKIPWTVALGIVFWSGILFLLVSATPLRETIARAIPQGLRTATAAGIGMFLTFIGLKNAGIIAADPVTLVKLGSIGPEAGLAVGGLILTAWLLMRRSAFAFLGGIFAVTAAAWALGFLKAPEKWVSPPAFELNLLKADIWGALRLSLLPAALSILFTDLFDSISTFIGVSHAAGLVEKDGQPKNLREGLIVDAFATLGGGIFGTSPGTAYIESAAGIEMGGRTGWTSVFTALCFLPCFFLAPLASAVPAYATAPVLVLVGAFMFKGASHLALSKLEDAVPAFLTILMIPLTFSITQGIFMGFLSHTGMYLLAGRRRELHPMMYGLAVISMGLLLLEHGNWRL